MSHLLIVTLIVCCLSTKLAFSQEIAATSPDKYALLIGVEDYQHEFFSHCPIQFAVNDVRALSRVLLENGYNQVDVLTDAEATLANIRAKLAALNTRGTNRGVVLIGLFGHGVELKTTKLSYFCPTDTRFEPVAEEAEADEVGQVEDGNPLRFRPVAESMVSLNEILGAIAVAPAKDRILIADCCRDDPIIARGVPFASSFTLDPNLSVLVLLACQKGKQAFERRDPATNIGHGLLTAALIDEFEAAAVDGDSVLAKRMKSISGKVNDAAKAMGKQQTPLGFGSFQVELQLKSPEPTPGTKLEVDMLGLTLVRVPPARQETKGFWIGESEVTQRQFAQVLKSSPWNELPIDGDARLQHGDNFPAVGITWEMARRFCEVLTDSQRRIGALSSNEVYRLPTSKEWLTARASGQLAPQPQNFGQHAWYADNCVGRNEPYAHEVKSKEPDQLGIYDMFGNVFEWCANSHSSNARFKQVIGGSWKSDEDTCVSPTPLGLRLDYADATIGFRIVRSYTTID